MISTSSGPQCSVSHQLDIIFVAGGCPILDKSLYNMIFNPHSTTLTLLSIPGQESAFIEFYTKYAIAIISAALGLAKCLKNGVARPIAPDGPLHGYLTGKFFLGFLASAVGLVARGTSISLAISSRKV